MQTNNIVADIFIENAYGFTGNRHDNTVYIARLWLVWLTSKLRNLYTL